MCDSDCVEWLKARALAEYEAAESAARSPKRRANEPLIRRRATALGWAAGELQAHQAGDTHNPAPGPDPP